jgi:predicted HicB family RNase H-like nuclease
MEPPPCIVLYVCYVSIMQLNYRIPDDLHRALKVRAAQEGVTLKALIIRLLTEAVKK